jgi:hypothetical protein
VPVASPGIPLQQPRLQRPVDHAAQHHRVVAQVVQPAAAGARRQAEVTEHPAQRNAGALVADHSAEPAAVMAQRLDQVSPWRSAKAALDCLQIEQGLPGASTIGRCGRTPAARRACSGSFPACATSRPASAHNC